jgi:hypothetical protein
MMTAEMRRDHCYQITAFVSFWWSSPGKALRAGEGGNLRHQPERIVDRERLHACCRRQDRSAHCPLQGRRAAERLHPARRGPSSSGRMNGTVLGTTKTIGCVVWGAGAFVPWNIG